MNITILNSTVGYSYTGNSQNGITRIESAFIATETKISLNTADTHQNALEKLNQILTSAYEKLSPNLKSPADQYQQHESLTAEKVAKNILGFIERRLQQDQAEGASAEQLQSRLDAGLSGFKKGFAEAEEQLKALSLLSPAIEEDLSTTNRLVLSGIDALQAKLINGENLTPKMNTSNTVPKLSVNNLPVGVVLAAQLTQAYKFSEIDYSKAEAREFQFEVTTSEGDKVTINAASSYGADISRQGTSLVGSYSESRRFSLVVDGDLNEDEYTSINNLLYKVNQLAENFYSGDLDTAFSDAMNLDFSDKQINQFSVHLAQSQIEVARQVTKTSIAQTLGQPLEKPDALVKDTSADDQAKNKLMDTLLSALDDARLFKHPEKLVLDIAQRLHLSMIESLKPSATDIEHPKNFDDFLARLINSKKP